MSFSGPSNSNIINNSTNFETLNNSTNSLEMPGRRTSTSRFEIERVEESSLNRSPTIPEMAGQTEGGNSGGDGSVPRQTSQYTMSSDLSSKGPHPSALKKTVKHIAYDDNSFDFESNQNTATKAERTKFLTTKSSLDVAESEPLTALLPKNSDDDDMNASCFQINYDERNEPRSITCNLSANGVESYKNCVHDFKTIALYQKLIAEFIGTLLLTLYACSIGLPIAEKQVPSINGCLGGGLTLATLVWCMGNISGGHFNPAVTVAFLFTGKINPLLTFFYVGAQLVGGLTGAFILKSLSPTEAAGNLSVTLVHKDLHVSQAYAVELLITFILVFTIFSCVDSRRNDLGGSFPLQIGLAVTIGALFGGKFTGGSMNPARSFGPAVATGIWADHWVYWLGPISGSILAGVIYQFILTLKCPRKSIQKIDSRSRV